MTNTQAERTVIEEKIKTIEEKIKRINTRYEKLLYEASIEAREKIANIEANQGKKLAQLASNLKTQPQPKFNSQDVCIQAKEVRKEITQLFKTEKRKMSQSLKKATNYSKKKLKEIRNRYNFELQPELRLIKELKKLKQKIKKTEHPLGLSSADM